MLSDGVQKLIEEALGAALKSARNANSRLASAKRVAQTPDDAQKAITATINALSASYDTLHGAFQAKIAVKDFDTAEKIKAMMTAIALTQASLDRKIVELYEKDSAEAAAAIGPILKDLNAATEKTKADTDSFGDIGVAVTALTALIGLVK